MALSVAQLLAAAETCGEALRLLRAARDLTQADLVAHAGGSTSADQISLIERGKQPMLSKQCTALAHALGLTDNDEARLMLLALIDWAPERLEPSCVGPDSGADCPPWRRASRPIPRSSSRRCAPH
jgi:transcriptional regulator with XRE-family HTH domain